MMNRICYTVFAMLCVALVSVGQEKNDSIKRTYNLQEVVVTGFRISHKTDKITQGQALIQQQMTADITDLVRYLPEIGISQSAARGNVRGFAIRGVEDNRVSISIDGVAQPEIQENIIFSSYGLSNDSRIVFDPYFVSAVEISKGADSFISGSGALGGSVNYTTKEAADIVRKNKQFGAVANLQYNAKNNMQMYLGGGAMKTRKVEALGMFGFRDGHEINNFSYGKLTRNILSTRNDPMYFKQHTLLGKIKYRPFAGHQASFAYYSFNRLVDAEIWSQAPIDIFTSEDKPYYYSHDQTLSNSFALNYDYTSGTSLISDASLALSWQNAYLDALTWSEYYRPNFYDNGNKVKYIYEGKRKKYRAQEESIRKAKATMHTKLLGDDNAWGRHRLVLTLDAMSQLYKNRNVDVENRVASDEKSGYNARFGKIYRFGESMGKYYQAYSFMPPTTRANYNISLLDKIYLTERLRVELGARYDLFVTKSTKSSFKNDTYYIEYLLKDLENVDFNFEPISARDRSFSYLAYAEYQLHDYLNMSAKFSSGFRVPTMQEKYFQYYSLWPSFLFFSNRELKPEKAINTEIGFRGDGEWLSYAIGVYYNTYHNFIDLEQGVLEVQRPFEAEPRRISYVKTINRQNATLYGGDISVSTPLSNFWQPLAPFTLSGAFSYAKGATDEVSMMSVQPPTGVVGLAYSAPNNKMHIDLKYNLYFAKRVSDTKFIEKTVHRALLHTYPATLLKDAFTLDLFGHYQFSPLVTLRAGVYNIFNTKYWRWDDLRQLINPALLPNAYMFFRQGEASIARFSQPGRYFSVSLDIKI